MRRTLLFTFLLLIIPASFSQISLLTDYPMREFCEQMQSLRLAFEGDLLEGTVYEGLTEFPPEMLEEVNNKISGKDRLVGALERIGGITFSAEISYNGSTCFAGSFMFNESELKFFRLDPDPLAGEDNEHISFQMELVNIEGLIKEWLDLQTSGEFNIIKVVSLFLRSSWRMLTLIIGNDIRIAPLSGLLRVVDGMTVLIQLPGFDELTEAF